MSATTVLLLHGLGGNAAVWDGVRGALGDVPVLTPDLPGHADGPRLARYDIGLMAASLAAQLDPTLRYAVFGHSLGGAVGLALASGWFGVPVSRVVGLGIKVAWTDAEKAGAAAVGGKPVAWFDSRPAAVDRLVKVAGLVGLVDGDAEVVRRGVEVGLDGRWRTTVEPGTVAAGAPDMAGLLAASRAEVVLARGELDPMVSTADLEAVLAGAPGAASGGVSPAGLGGPGRSGARIESAPVVLPGLGHNAHVEDPLAVAALVRRELLQAG